MTHLLAALSAHGFGHVGQTAPVIRELIRRDRQLRITLRTAVPEYKLTEHLGLRLQQQAITTDIGMLQANALEVELNKTAAAYAEFHLDWDRKVEQEAHDLLAARPDLVLSNISYLTLAAAAHAGIPAIALGNINWAEIYAILFGDVRPEAPMILQQMQDAYNSASIFLQPEPSMPMRMLSNRHPIGPIAQTGTSYRAEIAQRLDLHPETCLVLASLGGMEFRPHIEQWPRLPGIHVLVPASWEAHHPDITPLENLGTRFIDLLASSDILIAKPGYGSFVESAAVGVPVLYLPRNNWPEAHYLIPWLQRYGRCLPLEKSNFMEGHISDKLHEIRVMVAPSPPKATGTEEATEIILDALKTRITRI